MVSKLIQETDDMKIENVWMLLPGRKVGFGDIVVEGDKIAEITLTQEAESPTSQTPQRLVLPGLINCHCHAPMTLVRGLGGGLPLQRWLEEAICAHVHVYRGCR